MPKKENGSAPQKGGKTRGSRDSIQTTRNKIKRICRSAKGHKKNPFTGLVADPKNPKYPSQEAERYFTSTGIVLRSSTSKK